MSVQELSVMLLAFNEYGNLRRAVDDTISACEMSGLARYEVIVVDDGSTDGTTELADRIAMRRPNVTAVHHTVNRGLRDAYETGLAAASMGRVVWLPADNEMTLASVVRLFAAIGTADIATPFHGNPAARPWFRRFLTWFSTLQLNVITGHRLNYWQGTAVYDTALARSLPRTTNGFFFCAEMLAHAVSQGYSVVETPLHHVERTYGVSKAVSWLAIWRGQMAVLRIGWAVTANRMATRAHAALAN
jgi:glycosyltransferase involved in cell wall biosynthesis